MDGRIKEKFDVTVDIRESGAAHGAVTFSIGSTNRARRRSEIRERSTGCFGSLHGRPVVSAFGRHGANENSACRSTATSGKNTGDYVFFSK